MVDGHGIMLNKIAIIAGASAGGAVVTMLLILTIIMIIGIIRKVTVSVWNSNNLACEVELEVQHDYVVHEQWLTNEGMQKNIIVYADIGSSSADRSRPPASTSTPTLDLDEHRVEYAQLNHNAHSSNIADNSINEESDISLNLDSLLIQLQDKVTPQWYQFGIALGVEKAILDRCLNYHPEQSIIEILDNWLRNDKKQSWGEVARALRQINYHQLAKEIESIDKQGKFPVEVNMIEIPKGVLHRSDQRSNLADESPPPIPPRKRNGFEENPTMAVVPPIPPRKRNEFEENPTMAVVDLQHQDDFKYASEFAPVRPPKQ